MRGTNLIVLHFKIRRAWLDLLNRPSKADRDIERWVSSLTSDEVEMLFSRLFIFYLVGMSEAGIKAYIKKMLAVGVIRDNPG